MNVTVGYIEKAGGGGRDIFECTSLQVTEKRGLEVKEW